MSIFTRLRNSIKKAQTKRLIPAVEKTLGFKLAAWQVDYIFYNSAYVPSSRRSGKTLAHIVKVSLSKGSAIDLRNRPAALEFSDSEIDSRHYRTWYKDEFISIYKKLKTNKKIKLRKIVMPNGKTL